MSYHHLTISERIRIEVLSILGYSTRFIAKFLHRHYSTIARELSRNKIENEYVSISPHNNYLKRRKNSSHSSKYNDVLYNLISEKLHENWSPEQIYLLTIIILNVVKILLTLVNIMMFFIILFPKNYMKIGLQNRFLMHF